jgi:hypothetical protein
MEPATGGNALPCFRRVLPEDSLFLPCCEHRQGLISTPGGG